jgi:hypothetical protein
VDRTLTECVDWTNENLKLRTGTFLEPALHLTFGRGGLSARVHVYNSDSDLGELVMIGYSYGVGSRYAKAPEFPDVPEAPAGSR